MFVSYQSEADLEDNLIKQLETLDYEYVNIKSDTELESNLKVQLEKLNNTTFSNREFNSILTHLDGGSIFDKAKKFRDRFELERDDNTTDYIIFFDNHWCKNKFQVANQITVNGTYTNRYDVTILINGLPLVQIELKRRGIELKQAFNQIMRYKQHSYTGLFGYLEIFIISNGVNTKYFANNKKINYKLTFYWKDKENNNISNISKFTELFLDRYHLHQMINKYTVLSDITRDIIILRSYQYYAVEAILEKTLHSRENGYIWHTTGSGKTLTSFKASQLLSQQNEIDKVIFVVDRNDLDNQTLAEFNKFSNDGVDGTTNTKKLIRQLNGSDKLIVTTIQKLSRAVKYNAPSIEKVKNNKIVLMFDECHRSQFGEMHSAITKFFTNIQYFGFTGTPILAENRGQSRKTTHDIFGKCLHKYLIVDAIADENVLGFSVDYIGRIIRKTTNDEQVIDVNTKEVLESEERINQIVDTIIEIHDRKTYNREFTSILAVSSIPVLNTYYDLFKKKNHDLKIATIYSFEANPDLTEDEIHPRTLLDNQINDYNEMFGTSYSTDTFQGYYQDISKKSKDKKIDILLVVNMFLTGFDNKYLNTLYVDKNLEYHGLLQAYSRTNRLCNDKKAHGNIVVFRNLKEKTDEAIKLFSNENALETVIIKPYKEYVKIFNSEVEKLNKIVPTIEKLDDSKDVETEKEFIEVFRNILRTLNKLTPFDEFKFKDLNISQQSFEDYRSKYLDIYERVENPLTKESILNDIDFEMDLLRRDDINVSYILELLKGLDPTKPTFTKDKHFITQTMNKDKELRSKIDLIDEFISTTMVDCNVDTEEKLEQFMNQKRENAIKELVTTENLKEELIREILKEYEFSGKIKEKNVDETFNKKPKLKERRDKRKLLVQKIKDLIELFTW